MLRAQSSLKDLQASSPKMLFIFWKVGCIDMSVFYCMPKIESCLAGFMMSAMSWLSAS